MSPVTRLCLLALAVLLAACRPAAALTPLPYTEDFSDPAGGWKTVSDPAIQIQYRDGALRFQIDDLDQIAWSVPPDKRFGDFTLEVDATQLGGPDDNSYGVLIRYVDDRNFYRLDISGDGYFAVNKREDGRWTTLQDWTASPAIRSGKATNRLKVLARANTFTFSVNDQTLTTFTDAGFPQGNIGLTAGTLFDNAGVQIAFDNLSVTEASP